MSKKILIDGLKEDQIGNIISSLPPEVRATIIPGKMNSSRKPGNSIRSSSSSPENINQMLGFSAGKPRHYGRNSVEFEADGPHHLIIRGETGETRALTRDVISAIAGESSRLSVGKNKVLDVRGAGRIAVSGRFRRMKQKV